MANMQMAINAHSVLTVDFIRTDNGQPFSPTQPYAFSSSNEGALNFGAQVNNIAINVNTGSTPTAGIQVTVTSPELPGQSAVVMIDTFDNTETGGVNNAPPTTNSFRAGLS